LPRLTCLEVLNFQSHRGTTIKFSPGITAIVGSSDSGKTALVRALKWVVFNRPLGKSIIRQNSKGGCSVCITCEDVEVSKLRDSGGTNYRVGTVKFNKVGANVPHQVNDTLNLGEINFQSQLEPHFLVLKSGGQIANYISSVLKLDILDTAVGLSSRQIKEAERKRTELTATKQELEDKLTAYNTLDQVEKKVEAYLKMDAEATAVEQRVADLYNIIGPIEQVESELEEYEQLGRLEAIAQGIDVMVKEAESCTSSLSLLCDAMVELEKIETTLQGEERRVSLYTDELSDLQQAYEQELRDMGNCPWCGQELTDEAIEWKKDMVA